MVFGSKGCGKTTFLERFLKKYHFFTAPVVQKVHLHILSVRAFDRPPLTSYEGTKTLNTVASMVDIDDLQELDEESKFFIVGVPQFLLPILLRADLELSDR